MRVRARSGIELSGWSGSWGIPQPRTRGPRSANSTFAALCARSPGPPASLRLPRATSVHYSILAYITKRHASVSRTLPKLIHTICPVRARAPCRRRLSTLTSMPRKELDEEAYEGRRALLEALPKALKEVGLPVVVPALRANVGKPQPAKYDEVASTLRRADGTTKGEHVLKRALDAYNRAREAVATRRNVVPLKAIEPPAFYFVQQTLNPLGDLIGGRENEAAFARLTAGRNCADALDRLCRLQPPFPAEGEAGPSEAGPPTSPTVRGGTSALLRTRPPAAAARPASVGASRRAGRPRRRRRSRRPRAAMARP